MDGTFTGFNPSFGQHHDGDLDVQVRTTTAAPSISCAQLPAGIHAAGGLHVRQGHERRRHRRWARPTTRTPPTSGADWAIAGYDVPHKLALVGVVGTAVLQGQHAACTRLSSAAGSLPGRHPPDRQRRSTSPAAPPFPTGDYNADGNGGDRPNTPACGVKTSGWSPDEYLAGIFKVSDFPVPARGHERQPGSQRLPGSRLRGRQPVAVEEVRVQTRDSLEVRLDTFNVFNRVNLNNPSSDLSSSTFGTVTSQLATRAAQLGFRFRF